MARIRKVRRIRRATASSAYQSGPAGEAQFSQDPRPTTVLVVAPTALRTVFVSRMVTFEGVSLAGVAETEPSALERAVKDRPDVAAIDMDLGGRLKGLDLARTIQKVAPKTGILIMVKSLQGIDLRAEARSFGSSWSYMWRAMIEDQASTEAVLKSVGSGVHWMDPKLRRVLTRVWNIAAMARDLERESLRELVAEQDLDYSPSGGNGSAPGIQSVSVGDGGRGQGVGRFSGVSRAS